MDEEYRPTNNDDDDDDDDNDNASSRRTRLTKDMNGRQSFFLSGWYGYYGLILLELFISSMMNQKVD